MGGGYETSVRDVMKLDTLREFAASDQLPMLTPRQCPAGLYHSQYLYVLGGMHGRWLSECERFSCAENRWEGLPALPVAGWGMSAVELDNSLYALGGQADNDLDAVQRLSLDSLTWELMHFKLPQAVVYFPCFKTDTQVYLLIKDTLYSFTLFQPIKTLNQTASNYYFSYYTRGTLYYTWYQEISALALGELD
jgi:hypothetical protein